MLRLALIAAAVIAAHAAALAGAAYLVVNGILWPIAIFAALCITATCIKLSIEIDKDISRLRNQ